MLWTEVLIKLVEVVFYIVVSIGIPFLFSFVRKYTTNAQIDKLLTGSEDIVKKCVAMVNQTFVDSLKKEGTFDADAQKEAFGLARAEILKMLSFEAQALIMDQLGDIDDWLKIEIEAAVAAEKKSLPIK